MHRTIRRLAALGALTLLGACASGILRLDQDRYGDGFDLQDQQGSLILGPPSGAGSDSFGVITPPVSVTDDTPGGMGLAVRIGDRAEFNTAEHAVPDRYLVVWTGARTAQDSATTRVILRNDAGAEALRIRYQFNQLQVIWASDAGPGPINLDPGVPHEVRVTLNMTGANAAADVSVTQNGRAILARNNLRFISGAFSRLDVVEVRSQTDYFVKDLVAVTVED